MGTLWGFVMGSLLFGLMYCLLAGDHRGVVDLLTLATGLGALLFLRRSLSDERP